MPVRAPIDVRLKRNVVPDVGGCWRWTGEKRTGGYGYIQVDRKDHRAHRVSYETFIGPIPPGLVVMHSCDQPDCIFPGHLSLGTFADNNRDMREKGRWSPPPLQTGKGRPLGPRQSHCRHGHLLPAYEPGLRRRCKTCNNEQQRIKRSGARPESAG